MGQTTRWADMILSAAADVATIRHIARAPRATSHGVAIAEARRGTWRTKS